VNFTPPDILILLILSFFTINGFRHGFIDEIARIIGMASGFVVAQKYHPNLMPYLELYFINPNILQVISYLIVFFIALTIVNLIAIILRKFFELIFLGWLNRLLGTLLGFLKGILIVSLIIFVMQIVPIEIRTKLENDSYMYKICNNVKNRIIRTINFEYELDDFQNTIKQETIQEFLEKQKNNP